MHVGGYFSFGTAEVFFLVFVAVIVVVASFFFLFFFDIFMITGLGVAMTLHFVVAFVVRSRSISHN